MIFILIPWLVLSLVSFYPLEALGWEAEQKSAAELTQGPARKFVSEAEREEFIARLREADLVFTAKIQGIILSPVMGLRQPPVYTPQITFEEIKALKGQNPPDATFSYRGSPETLEFSKGSEVLVTLERPNARSDGFTITAVVEASQPNLDLAREIISK